MGKNDWVGCVPYGTPRLVIFWFYFMHLLLKIKVLSMRYLTPEQWEANLTRSQRERVDRIIAKSERCTCGVTIKDLINQRKKRAIPKHSYNVKEYDTVTNGGAAVHVEYRY